MYTKPETYYILAFRKSPKSYRANNYDILPYEFKTKEDAKKYADYIKYNTSKYCEIIIIEQTNNPVETIQCK